MSKSSEEDKAKEAKILEGMFQEVRVMQTKITRDMIVPLGNSLGAREVVQANSFFNDMVNGVYKEANKFVDKRLNEEQQKEIKGAKTEEEKNKLREKFDKDNPEAKELRDKVKAGLDKTRKEAQEALLSSMPTENSQAIQAIEALKEKDDKKLKEALVMEVLEESIKRAKITSRKDKVIAALKETISSFDTKALSNDQFVQELTVSLTRHVHPTIRTMSNTISTKNLESIKERISVKDAANASVEHISDPKKVKSISVQVSKAQESIKGNSRGY